MTSNVLPLPINLSAPQALRIIREVTAAKGGVIFHAHAKQRMRKRHITPGQVFACLRLGVIIEGPSLDMKGNWRCTMYRLAAGEEVKVVVSLLTAANLIVITVM